MVQVMSVFAGLAAMLFVISFFLFFFGGTFFHDNSYRKYSLITMLVSLLIIAIVLRGDALITGV